MGEFSNREGSVRAIPEITVPACPARGAGRAALCHRRGGAFDLRTTYRPGLDRQPSKSSWCHNRTCTRARTRPCTSRSDQQTHSVRPLLKVQTPGGHEAVADRLIVGFTPFVSAAEMADIHSAAARAGAGRARPVLHVGGKTYLVDVSGAVSLETAAPRLHVPRQGALRRTRPHRARDRRA